VNREAAVGERGRGPSRRAFLKWSTLAASAVLLSAGCNPLRAPALGTPGPVTRTPMTFMAGYKPQANISFVGVYVAHDLGYFAAQGLDVTIKHDASGGEHTKLLAAKQIQVATEDATDVIKASTDANVPLVSLAVLTQSGDEAMAALKSSGITSPQQFEGKTVGYKVYPSFEYLAMLQAAHVDRSKIHEVSVGFDPRILTTGKVDVLPVFKSNEPDVLQRMGFPVNLIDPATYGVLVMGQTWATHRDLLAANPDQYQRFVKAALQGVYYSYSHFKEAIDIVMRYAPTEDRAHQEFMLGVEQKTAMTEQTRTYGLGWQTLEQWTQLEQGMSSFGLIQHRVSPANLFTDTIEKNIYRNGKLIWP
jgi:putative hydroxymethylpyrimidine transport system substrate-binding protein